MKKFLPFFLIALFSAFIISCTSNDDNHQDYDTIAAVYEIPNVNFDYNNGYQVYRQFQNPLFASDMILVYMQTATANGNPVWELLPKTYYFNNGDELDYTFDFTRNDVTIYAGGTFDLTGTQYIRNQTFRVVVIPAYFGKGTNTVDFNNYNEVIKHYKINDQVTKKL